MNSPITLTEDDLHLHLRTRMEQRGITREEVEKSLNEGWVVPDAKEGTLGKVFVFPYNGLWEEIFYEEKEVTVYYKLTGDRLIILTAKARYGNGFHKKKGDL